MPKPSDFFFGILDLFAVLLPGAIATFVLSARLGASQDSPFLYGLLLIPRETAAAWALFVVASYFLGHMIFMLGSLLDGPFHFWRACYRSRETDRPGVALRLVRKTLARLSHFVRKKDCYTPSDELFDAIISYRRSLVKSEVEISAFNSFQWSRSLLMEKAQAAASDVHRLEADSKFFRGLAVLLALLAVDMTFRNQLIPGAATLGLSMMCIWQYGARRWKSEQQAYIHVLTLQKVGTLPSP